ncbi:Na-translocating system protein MpsC family protein [Mesobacillus sp.]|uniref:Na-translocating system protein MpsC family protein n=1 Tax=Mesobacillus sp. TaxID=2675271 RepID=UPI0039F0D273
MEVAMLEKEISGYIGKLLRENFGRGPGNVFCTVSKPFVSIYITNFLSPMENTLLTNQQSVYVQKTRDLMMDTLEEEIKSYIELNTKDKIKEFYYDWNLDEKTGMLLFIFDKDQPYNFDSYDNKKLVEKETIELSMEIQKAPEETHSKLLNERTLIIVRQGILISLEKEFIQLGFQETLKIAKRNLEKKVITQHQSSYERYLNAKITDYFVDWNFDKDKSYTLFILKS